MTPHERSALLAQIDPTATIEKNGATYGLAPDDLLACAFSNEFSSSWAVASVVTLSRTKLGHVLTRAEALSLCAAILRTTVEAVERAIDWNANYMAWHDAMEVEDCHVWPPDPV